MLYINNYRKMQISIIVTLNKNKIKRVIRVFNKIIVAASSSTIIFIQFRNKKLSKKRNLMFILTKESNRFEINNKILSYIINVNLCAIQINNTSSKAIIIFKNSRLSFVYKYEEESCYITSSKYSICLTTRKLSYQQKNSISNILS